jgi:tetratricopeptide (TPR) repeat protein
MAHKMSAGRLGYIGLFLVCLAMVFVAGKWGLANLYFYKADYYLTAWTNQSTVPDKRAWNEAIDAIESAVELHPQNPLYQMTLAKVLEWGAHAEFGERDDLLQRSLLALQKGLAMRPSWSDGWLNAAYIKWRLEEIDEDFWRFGDNAIRFGSYAAETNLGMATIYLAFWSALDSAQKVIAIEQIERALSHHYHKDYQINYSQTLFSRAQRYQKEAVLCALIKVKSELKKHQSSVSYKRHCA